MATHKSAAKRARQAVKRRARNSAVKTGLKNVVRKFRETSSTGNTKAVADTLKSAVRSLQKAASRRVLTKKTASRRVSRLMRAAAKVAKA